MTSPLAPTRGARPRTPADARPPSRSPLAVQALPPALSDLAGALLPAMAARGEQVRGLWAMGEGLLFIDYERHAGASPAALPPAYADMPGFHHFRVHAPAPDAQGAQANSGLDQAHAMQVALPDVPVLAEGAPAHHGLHVTMAAGHLGARAARLGIELAPIAPGRTTRSDLGVGCLVRAHQAGIALGMSGRQPYFDSLRLGIEERLVALYLRQMAGAEAEPEVMAPARARRAIDYLEENIGDDLRLDMLAAAAGMSKSHFSRSFRNTFGVSPHAFVILRRLARALVLLRARLSVGEVASRCGFSDHAHLTRQFKRAFGVPPSALARAGAASSAD